jgi:rod shape-determining protein MreD
MRWIPFILLTLLVVLLQRTLGPVLTFTPRGIGSVGPDLAAMVAVYVACQTRTWEDAMLGGWLLGFAVDIAVGAAGVAVGPMAITYALAAGLLFRSRDAFFHERAVTQGVLGMGFCLVAHGLWVTFQSMLGSPGMDWNVYGHTMLQAALLALYTGGLMPLAHALLRGVRRLIIVAPAGRGGRR